MYKYNEITYICRRIDYLKESGVQFVQIPLDVLRLTTGNEYKIYAYLVERYNRGYQYAFPKQTTIADATNLGLATVKRCIKSLEEKKLIKIIKFEGKDGYANNCYRIYFPIISKDERLESKKEKMEKEFNQLIKQADEEIEKILNVEEIKTDNNIDGQD